MNNETILLLEKYFDVAFAAPDGVKKLRELILSLAMQGKLVPQDPSDQSASELLKEIEAEKSRLVKDGKIKASKALPEINPEEVPYNLPKSWEWVRLGSLFRVTSGTNLTKDKMQEGIYPVYGGNGIAGYHSEFNTEKTTIVIGRVGYYCGSIHLTPKHAWITDNAFFTIYDEKRLYQPFVIWLLKKINLQTDTSATAQPVISGSKIYPILIPLPPLAEQRRIVAKIDELMARCDELEKLRQVHAQKQITVHNAALNQLLTAKDHNDFKTSWHFITQHFGELYSVKANVTELRKAILQLAVMGKLVPQDPNDQPASELLNAIEVEKNRLVKEGKIRMSPHLPEISPDEVPYNLPKGWMWIKLGCVGAFERGRSKHRPRNDQRLFSNGSYPFVQTGDVSKAKLTNYEINSCSSYYNDFGLQQSRLWEKGTLCITIAANIAETGFLGMEACIPDSVVAFISIDESLSKFVKVFIDIAKQHLEHFAPSTAQKNINLGIINDLAFPLPPLAEQHRIVAKIDQLMTLCDELEKQIDIANSKKTNLLNSVMTKV